LAQRSAADARDRLGEALFTGTPQGFNHFYDLYSKADDQPDWAGFHFTTEEGGNVPKEELDSAAREMDERLYRQEFRASFEELRSGRIYWGFDRKLDVREDIPYNERLELCWTLDFNVDPGCSLLCQISQDKIFVLDEIALANSNTYEVCKEFLRRTKSLMDAHEEPGRMNVRVYGDATGDNRKSSASKTDWQIVRDFFRDHDHLYNVRFDLPSKNPEVADRFNCVNAKIVNAKVFAALVSLGDASI
jgi:hypothetical protein